ncbi:hypothetical protein [Microbacterium cremeum]|uniref:hypothetical protein n=1 Tax=Microbacterium cremeum TaxID=2782169 RepID=UPI001888C578|nr:hypothetical protein [Microbacterium cremeum]
MGVASGDGFGPEGPTASGAPPFAVAGPTQVALDPARTGTGSFTVSNVSGRPVRARLLVMPGAGADASWFTIEGGPERALPLAGTATVDVAVSVPGEVTPGGYSFTVGAALEEAPDQVVPGPTVALTVPAARRRKFPWWIVIVAAVALVLLIGAGAAVWLLTRPDPQPDPTPTPTSTHDVFAQYSFPAFGNLSYDLDGERAVDYSVEFEIADLYFSGALHGTGFLSVVGYGNASLAVVDDPTFEACESALDYTTGEPITIPAEAETFVCVRFTDQERRALMAFQPSEPATGLHVVDTTVWARGE